MTTKYILMECNRLNSQKNYKNINENEDEFKNRWVNNVNSTGIVVNPGDVITCESSAINTQGASDSTMELVGKETQAGFMDTQFGLDLTYYINDVGTNTIKLPTASGETYYGIDKNSNDKYNLLNRANGEPYIVNYDKLSQPLNDTGFNMPGYPNQKLTTMTRAYYTNFFTLSTTQIGTGYVAGDVYKGNPADAPSYQGVQNLVFKCTGIQDEGGGGSVGIPTGFEIIDYSSHIELDPTVGLPTFGLIKINSSTPTPTANQFVTLRSVMNDTIKSKSSFGATGRKFYLPDRHFTGLSWNKYAGVPNLLPRNDGQASTTVIPWHYEKPKFFTRRTKLKLEVPTGLETPDNIASILTTQLTKPTSLNVLDGTKYASYQTYEVKSIHQNGQSYTAKPPIVETPTYTPMACNFGNSLLEFVNPNGEQPLLIEKSPPTKQFPGDNDLEQTFFGALRSYHANVGYEEPERIEGLGCFRRFYYGINNDIVSNQINSGLFPVAGKGDFRNQAIGNVGLLPSLLMQLPADTDTQGLPQNYEDEFTRYKRYNKGGWLLTNIYFTEINIRNIAEGFKKAEKYWGNLDEPFDTSSVNYHNNLAVHLDLGMYVDDKSRAYPYNGNEETISRYRFKTFWEYESQGTIGIIGDSEESIFAPIGWERDPDFRIFPIENSIPWAQYTHYDGNPRTDGAEMPSIVVSSRFSNYVPFDANNIHPSYQQLYDNLISDESFGNQKFSYYVPGGGGDNYPIEDAFQQTYTDPEFGTLSTSDLIAMAEKYDLCAVPVFPTDLTNDFYKFGGRPYIAFRSHLQIQAPKVEIQQLVPSVEFTKSGYNPLINGTDQFWQIGNNCSNYGSMLGYDVSKIRNNAVMIYNTNYANANANFAEPSAFNSMMMMGASNPSINFDTSLSRFTISGLNTPITIGNGSPTDNPYILEPTTDPEQEVYNLNVMGCIGGYKEGSSNVNGSQIPQVNGSIIDSYSGLSIEAIVLYDKEGNETELLPGFKHSNSYNFRNQDDSGFFKSYDKNIIYNNVLDKMGFQLEDLLPAFGRSSNNRLEQSFITKKLPSNYTEALDTLMKPLTTTAYISSPEYQPASANLLNMPLYDLGTNTGLQSRPSVQSASIIANNLPSKLDYPYLLVYSSIIQGGTDTEYYGGQDGKSKLPVIGYITRNYNQGDFFYGLEQSFTYTATKSFVLSEIETEIRLPDGSRPRLQPHNSVIYKITREVEPIGISGALPENKISRNDKNEERKRIQKVRQQKQRI